MAKIKPPYRGQGESTSDALGVEGQWIVKDLFFICDDEGIETNPNETISDLRTTSEAKPVLGFETARVAAGLGVSPESLYEANRNGELALTNKLIDQDTMRVEFTLKGKTYGLTMRNVPGPTGTA